MKKPEMSGGEVLGIHCDYGYGLQVSQVIGMRVAFSDGFLKSMTTNSGISRILQNIRNDYRKDTKYTKPTSLEETREIYIITALNFWLYDHDVDVKDTGLDRGRRFVGLSVPKSITVEEYMKVGEMLVELDKCIGISSLVLERVKYEPNQTR